MRCRLCRVQATADDKFADYKPRVAFLFPGQGAQTVGMAKELVETVPAAKELFGKASDILGYDLLQVCVEGAPWAAGMVGLRVCCWWGWRARISETLGCRLPQACTEGAWREIVAGRCTGGCVWLGWAGLEEQGHGSSTAYVCSLPVAAVVAGGGSKGMALVTCPVA